MITSALFIRRQAKIFESSPANINDKFEKHEIDARIYDVSQTSVWLINLILTIIPGLLGVLILLKGFLKNLIGKSLWNNYLIIGILIIGTLAIIGTLLIERNQIKKEFLLGKTEIRKISRELHRDNNYTIGEIYLNEATRFALSGNIPMAIIYQIRGIESYRQTGDEILIRNATDYLIRSILPLFKPEHYQVMEDKDTFFKQLFALFPENIDIAHIEIAKTLNRVAATLEEKKG